MPYEPTVLRRASARLRAQKELRERERYALRQRLYQECPELSSLDAALGRTMAEVAELALSGGEDAGCRLEEIKARNLSLQQERAGLLARAGYGPNALDGAPACPKCRDTGWVGARMCGCLKELCAQEQIRALTALLNLTDEQSFDQLRLDIYSDQPWNGKRSPRETMERVIGACESYARQFPDFEEKNLLLSGGTGLGKTFLSGCIAREVSKRGYSVVYDTAGSVFGEFDASRFSRDGAARDQARGSIRQYLNCDLMILDDLGTEQNLPSAQSSLYELVNGRIQSGRHTVISTNLSAEEIGIRYGAQLGSRIAGLYWELAFYGRDLRLPEE